MRFPEEFLNELKSRVRLSDVIGKKVALRKRGRDFVGLSPFSNEKTPSFYVHDDRGFYKCFSTQKAGDVITFLMETERLSFAEAVEKLAQDYGLELPRQTAGEERQHRRYTTLIEWVEKACQFFELQLRRPQGRAARAYLQRRGLDEEAFARHRLGFAPDGWRHLIDHLTSQGASAEELIEAGLVVKPDADGADGRTRQPYDRFRNRVIFPITDTGGRVIAFGARTLEPDGKPKYLNSSDSPLFHKGRTLYRYKAAREEIAQVRDAPPPQGLIVTEGYVDAITLSEAGIAGAVAPLGTALTEEQLELLWRAGPEPVLCFDGDAAGVRAAWRACDRALPLLEPGKSLFFALLPDGMDPDDVVRVRGAQAMRDILASAAPLVDLLWTREVEAEPLDTPERRAGLEARLMRAVGEIRHPVVRRAYERELRDRLYWRSRGSRQPSAGPPAGPSQAAARKGLSPGPTGLAGLRLVVRALESPLLMEQGREMLFRAVFPDPDVAAIRDAAFLVYDSADMLDRHTVGAHLTSLGLTRAVELLETFPVGQPMDPRSNEGRDWLDAIGRFPVVRTLVSEIEETKRAEGEGVDVMSPAHQARLMQKVIARRSASRSVVDETVTFSAQEGVQELRDALGGMGAAMESKRSED